MYNVTNRKLKNNYKFIKQKMTSYAKEIISFGLSKSDDPDKEYIY